MSVERGAELVEWTAGATRGQMDKHLDVALDTTGDPVGAVLSLCNRGMVALTEAQTIAEGQNVLGVLSTLEHACKVRDLNAEACVAASAMRVRAERRVGELIRAEREAGTLAARSDGPALRAVRNTSEPNEHPASDHVPPGNKIPETLADHGISRKQAAEFGRLADADEATFEKAVAAEAEKAEEQGGTNVTRSGVLRQINPEREKSPDERWIEADRFFTTCKKLAKQKDAAVSAIRFGVYPGDLPLVPDAVERALSEAEAALAAVRREWDRRKR